MGITNWCNNGNNPLNSRHNWMRIHKPGTTQHVPGFTSADSIVLTKPKEFDQWTSMYNFLVWGVWERENTSESLIGTMNF